MKVWITAYPFGKGLFQVDAELVKSQDGDVVYASRGALFTRAWVKTEQAARDAWECARQKKIASLKKQLAKLEAMTCKFAKVAKEPSQ